MNKEEYLIIIKGEDKTEKIYKFKPNRQFINVQFIGSEKEYSYARDDFQLYRNPTKIDVTKNKFIWNGGLIYNVEKALQFEKHCKLFFKGNYSKTVQNCELSIVKNSDARAKSTNIFEYFKEIAQQVGIKTDIGGSLLENEYKKIDIIEADTALYKYLNPSLLSKKNSLTDNTIICPVEVSKSQYEAVENALENQISIIEGPPGTGKTQTIINIIANIVKNGKTVAVVSNTNSATDNVYEKMQENGLDYICARLGKKENKEEFLNEQTGKYPRFEKTLQNPHLVIENIKKINDDITEIFKLKNEVAKKSEELSEIELEHKYFKKYEQNLLDINVIKGIVTLKSDKVLKLKVECEDLYKCNGKLNVWFKIKSGLIYGIKKKNFYNGSIENIIKNYNSIYYYIKEMELKKEINERRYKLKQLKDENKLEELRKNSLKILNELLRIKYEEKEERRIFQINDFFRNPKEVNKEYPVILSTTHSIKNCFRNNYKFDYIIMDESSQVDLITGVLALSATKNMIIVGDDKQLPNIVTYDEKEKIEEIAQRYEIEECYNYLNQSFLSSVKNTLIDAPKVTLVEHYRCHPKIIEFCNKKFYNDELIIMTKDNGEKDVMSATITSEGNHARGHFNQRQIDEIKEKILPELTKKVGKENIGIISPYKMQKKALKNEVESEITIDTIHKFQGRQKDAIIITTVDNEIGEFVDDSKLLNVAVSRAKRYLRVVTSNSKKNKGTNVDDLVKYIKYNNFEVINSDIKSIYDLLYKVNDEKRKEYFKGHKRTLEQDSEEFTYNLIEKILKEKFNNLDVAAHVPLREVINNTEKLSQEQRRYAENILTHLDFVIFNKMDKKIVLAIEVNGYEFHKEGTKQSKRDELKKQILKIYDIPQVILETTGSGEEKKIVDKLKKLFNNV